MLVVCILGDPGAASGDDGIFMGESLQQERESPWALTLTERVPEAFEIPPSDWPIGEKKIVNSRTLFISFFITKCFATAQTHNSRSTKISIIRCFGKSGHRCIKLPRYKTLF